MWDVGDCADDRVCSVGARGASETERFSTRYGFSKEIHTCGTRDKNLLGRETYRETGRTDRHFFVAHSERKSAANPKRQNGGHNEQQTKLPPPCLRLGEAS
jgi:hypothetical protein